MSEKIYTSADQLIGGTPLLELTHIEKKLSLEARILAKLEYFNPAGSVKDRIAKAMIDEAEEKGLLNKDSVIIEPTSRQAATRESVLRRSPRRAGTGSSSSCPKPCRLSAASS